MLSGCMYRSPSRGVGTKLVSELGAVGPAYTYVPVPPVGPIGPVGPSGPGIPGGPINPVSPTGPPPFRTIC